MNIRIQTYSTYTQCSHGFVPINKYSGGTAVDALKKGLVDIQEVCDVVADEFWTKREAYNAEQGIDR